MNNANLHNGVMRYASVDALRGLTVAAMLLVNDAGDWSHVYALLEHAPWHGCRPADFIFPLFLFIVGVSIQLALVPRRDAGVDAGELARAALVRAARIVALGLVLHLAATLLIDGRAFRLFGVLQRIGLCFAAAGVVALYLRPRTQWLAIGALLAGYAALLALYGYDERTNLAARIDTALLGRLAYQYDAATGYAFDPEGVLSTLGALATTLIGVRAGAWLRAGRVDLLIRAGLVMAAAGYAASFLLPWNKALWTPSYVLWTSGFGLFALALAHLLIDRRGWPPVGRAFGVNAIGAYAGAWLMVCVLAWLGVDQWLYRTLFAQPLTPLVGPYAASAAWAVAFTGLWWALAAWADRWKVYWKI
jgi:predicted acyltransferase